MGKKRHSKESIIQTLQNLARSLGKTSLSGGDVNAVLPVSSVNSYFGSLGNALEAAGLERHSSTEHLSKYRKTLCDEDLFQSVLRVEQEVGHEPRGNEYAAFGSFSLQPFRARFGTWKTALAHYQEWKTDNAVSEPRSAPTNGQATTTLSVPRDTPTLAAAHSGAPAQLYGEPIDFRGLRHAPINEQGVVYLFGMVSRELGFYIEAIQQGFPDCEGKYLYDAKKGLWAKARIEFEFRASNFREHGHNPDQCDFVVCWINDWPDCPVKVIDLKREILKLPLR
jgi:hypothetical protein